MPSESRVRLLSRHRRETVRAIQKTLTALGSAFLGPAAVQDCSFSWYIYRMPPRSLEPQGSKSFYLKGFDVPPRELQETPLGIHT